MLGSERSESIGIPSFSSVFLMKTMEKTWMLSFYLSNATHLLSPSLQPSFFFVLILKRMHAQEHTLTETRIFFPSNKPHQCHHGNQVSWHPQLPASCVTSVLSCERVEDASANLLWEGDTHWWVPACFCHWWSCLEGFPGPCVTYSHWESCWPGVWLLGESVKQSVHAECVLCSSPRLLSKLLSAVHFLSYMNEPNRHPSQTSSDMLKNRMCHLHVKNLEWVDVHIGVGRCTYLYTVYASLCGLYLKYNFQIVYISEFLYVQYDCYKNENILHLELCLQLVPIQYIVLMGKHYEQKQHLYIGFCYNLNWMQRSVAHRASDHENIQNTVHMWQTHSWVSSNTTMHTQGQDTPLEQHFWCYRTSQISHFSF